MSAKEALGMSDDRRALLTDREREILETDGADVSEKYYGVVVTRVRNKIGQLENDLPALERHDTLGEELRDVVCAGDESAAQAPRERSASQADRDTTSDAESREPSARAEGEGAHDHALADVVDAVAGELLPGSGEKLAARREALHAVVEYLREHGTAEPSDFRRDVYPDHPAGYVDADDPARSWWKNSMYPGLRALAERTDVIGKADTAGKWSYTDA